MADFFKKIGDNIASATEQAEIEATVNKELAASIKEIEEQAEEEVNITEADPGLEIADAGLRGEPSRTQEELRNYNRRVIEVNNAIKERNLAEGNKPTKAPEKGAYGKRRRRKRKYGRKKKKKAGKKKKKAGKKVGIVKGVKGAARNVTKTAKKVGKGATRTAKKVGRGADKIVKRVGRGADRIAKGLSSIFTQKRSFGRSTTPMPMYLEDYEQTQGYDPRDLIMQSLFGKRKKKKFGGCESCGNHKFGKRRRYKFGAGCNGKEKFSPKCIGQCSECGSSITGFDPMAIVQKKLSYGKKRRKRKFGDNCHCPGHKKFGKKVSKKPSAATRKMCKRLKVKMTLKRGGKRVYKSEKMLKKQCKTAMKRKKKKRKKKKTVKRRKRRFGMAYEDDEDEHYRRVAAEYEYYFPESRDVDILQLLISSPRHHDTIIKEINKAKEKEKLEYYKTLGYGLKYGKRRRKRKKSSFGKKAKKPSAALKKLCKKHKVRLTVKRKGKRVYKSEKMLKKQCKTAMKRKKKK